MQQKFLLPLILSFLLAFLVNFFLHNNLLVSAVNSLTLALSIYFSRKTLKGNFLYNLLIIISLGLIPLFGYLPKANYIFLFPFFTLIFLFLYNHFPKKGLLVVLIIFLFLGNSFSAEILRFPFDIQYSQLIFNSPEINYHLNRHQQDAALFIPFKLRQVLYSELIFVYAGFTNFFNFLNLKNLSEALLIANLYPLFLGLYITFWEKDKFRNFFLSALIVTAIVASLDRSPDKLQSLYLMGPVFVYLIMLGLQKINKKLYFAFWILTLFILINPKI